MPPAPTIPRFLLPQGGAIWRTRASRTQQISLSIRNASSKVSKKIQKPLVLEKPSKFTPPSHPQRLKAAGPRYSGPNLTAEESSKQKTKRYPSMMPPEGTLMFYLLTNRAFHMYLTLGVLATLMGGAFMQTFKMNSPFYDMIPPWTQIFIHPIAYSRTLGEVIRLDVERTSAAASERRKQKVEDVAKRAAYRKEHALDQNTGFGGWTAREDADMLGPGIPVGKITVASSAVAESSAESASEPVGEPPSTRKVDPPHSKKWFGIW